MMCSGTFRTMNHHFKKHYTLEEARSMLPKIRRWLERMRESRAAIAEYEAWAQSRLTLGHDLGGGKTSRWLKLMEEFRETSRMFELSEIQIKNLDRGLIDFPSIRDGSEIFLCWEMGENDIEYWHDLSSGFAGRQAL